MSTLIWSVPLGPHLTPTTTDATELLANDESWQSGIVEGPDMVETQTQVGSNTDHNYYLFYAGSDEGASTYGIGWASCPDGPSASCNDMSATGPCSARSRACRARGAPTSSRSSPPGSQSWHSPPGRGTRSAT